MSRDTVVKQRPFTKADVVFPFFVCFRFRNGTAYAASLQHAHSFPPDVLRSARISIHDRADALRVALSMPPRSPPQHPHDPWRFHAK